MGRRVRGQEGSNGHIEGGHLASRYDTGLTNDDDDYHLTLIIIFVFSQGMGWVCKRVGLYLAYRFGGKDEY
jgi:hypothetical protein